MRENDYSDIIFTEWPKKTLRPKMAMDKRAKIFLPFAALNGHNEAINNVKDSVVENIEKENKGTYFQDFLEYKMQTEKVEGVDYDTDFWNNKII